MSDCDKMGELIYLDEWRQRKDEEERNQIDDDIKRLTLELREMMEDMDINTGYYSYKDDWLDCLPLLHTLDETLSSYAGTDPGSLDKIR